MPKPPALPLPQSSLPTLPLEPASAGAPLATGSEPAVEDVDNPGNLLDAIKKLNGPGGTVRLSSSCIGQDPITLESTLSISNITIDASACLDANGLPQATMSGGEKVRAFETTANVTLAGLAIADGKATNGNGGGVFCSSGTLEMTKCTVSGCYTTGTNGCGGGVFSIGKFKKPP